MGESVGAKLHCLSQSLGLATLYFAAVGECLAPCKIGKLRMLKPTHEQAVVGMLVSETEPPWNSKGKL